MANPAKDDGTDTITAYRITIVVDVTDDIGGTTNPAKWDWTDLLEAPTTLETVEPIFDPDA